MALKLIYQVFAKLLSSLVLHARSDTATEIEILLLRHQLRARAARPFPPVVVRRSCVWPARPPPGAIGASMASSLALATTSAPPPSGRSCARRGSSPRPDAADRPGRSSFGRGPRHPGLRRV